MKNLKVLAIDDNPTYLKKLKSLLSENSISNIQLCTSYHEAKNRIANEDYDLIISEFNLDLGKTAVDILVDNLNSKESPAIILSRDYSRANLEKLEKFTFIDFLRKDCSAFDLEKSIKLLKRNAELRPSHNIEHLNMFFVRTKNKVVKVNVDIIDSFVVAGKYLEISTIYNSKYLIRYSLLSFLEKLPPKFIQVKKNAVVNLEYLEYINLEENLVKTKVSSTSMSRIFKTDILNKYLIS